ncbi:14 kDa proline-rich protein DC2.15-like isoform X2 [Tripterygium wilfordii]|uniref:14 kDa proline-rich protein DC2.15-like isoform X1 n=1 Tax=Tripterygium wilfordii TaxID=458696 RepID=UPI0018F7FD33|nr:14 kDa proline-rich protein DC2.15-like isoform X1 [Tripterygium wilfordii]XP_038687315.1 14 kDa proline-rich protein DC2.15-like isoform X2 [Tripterygium wilfordii]
MASKAVASTSLFLFLNLIVSFTFVNSTFPPAPAPAPAPDQSSPPPAVATCPKDTLKLGVCANVLKGLLGIVIGKPPVEPCCSLIGDLVDLEAALCLCTAIKVDLGITNLNVPIDLSLVLNDCGKQLPSGFQCP